MIGHFHFMYGGKDVHMQINGDCVTFCEDSGQAPCAGYFERQAATQVMAESSTEQRLVEAGFRFAIEVTQILEVPKIITEGTK